MTYVNLFHLLLLVFLDFKIFVVTFLDKFLLNTMFSDDFCCDIFPYRGRCHDRSLKKDAIN